MGIQSPLTAAGDRRDPLVPILVATAFILLISFGIRASYGVFQVPIAEDFGWPRAEFSLAIAVQNLFWGLGQPLFGMVADRFGDRKAIIGGALIYAAGLALAAGATTPFGQVMTSGVMVGLGVAGTGFGVLLAVVGRAASPEKRSMALGIATAFGSAGQVLVPPLTEWLERQAGWSATMLIFAAVILMVLVVLPLLKAPPPPEVQKDAAEETAHFPALVTEACGSAALGAASLTLIGITNIFGTLLAGKLGGIYRRKYLLSLIYALRTVVAIGFIMLPPTPLTVIVFSLSMGALWLATVPLTSGLIGYLYGMKYMGTLYGFVFLSHQLGGFLGVYLGGKLYDVYGSYDVVWWIGIGVGAFSAIAHLPIREEARQQAQTV
jgi:MFS family permease